MKSKLLLIISFVVSGHIYSQRVFNGVDSILNYAAAKSITLQSRYLEFDQAKKAKLAALLSIPDVSGNGSLTYTNNTKLPVNLFPAEVFGGQPGTFKEVTTGIPYVTNFNENIDVKLLNLKGWQNLKLYNLNIASSNAEIKITLKTLLEDVASAYYNIVSLQQQLANAVQNVNISKQLLNITQNKYDAGLIKQQDVNDTKATFLTSEENKRQIEYSIEQQYLALKILCDIPETEEIQIADASSLTQAVTKPTIESNNLDLTNYVIKEKTALFTYKQQKYSLYPNLSFFQSYTYQQNNTRGKLFDNSVNWIPSSYIGLKLSFPIPSSTNLSQVSSAKYDYLLAKKSTEQQKIKSSLQLQQLSVEFDKAVSQANGYSEIYSLRKETYEKNLNLYNEGLTSLEQTLDSFNEMVNSSYNLVSSQVSVLAAKTKIEINNRVK